LRHEVEHRRVDGQRERGRDQPSPQESRGEQPGRLALAAIQEPEDRERHEGEQRRQAERLEEHPCRRGAQAADDRTDDERREQQQDGEQNGGEARDA